MNKSFIAIIASAVLAMSACSAASKLGISAPAVPAKPTHPIARVPAAPTSSSDSDWKKEMLTREHQRSLLGMTPDQAKQRLKELGHTGSVQVVHDLHYVAKCGSNKVCEVEPGADMSLEDDVTLTINPESHIEAPAADD